MLSLDRALGYACRAAGNGGARARSSARAARQKSRQVVVSTDPALLSATDLLRQYRSRELSPVEVVGAVFDRIEACGEQVNAFCLLDRNPARASARESEARWRAGKPSGRLDGVPVTIKDLILTRGWPTLRGSRIIDSSQAWDDDAPVTAALRRHGAVLIGKTTTPEFGWKGVTDNALTGITRNPWNTAMTPGGSSGGAAAACALGMGALHVGTDGGGSIRIPAGFTGIFGIKPSFGRVPAWPLSPFGTVSHVGPMTRTVADAALMLTVISEPDARDWHALPYTETDYLAGLDEGIDGLRIGYSPDLGYADVDPEIAAAVDASLGVLEQLGARVEEVPPMFDPVGPLFLIFWASGAAQLLRGFPPHLRDLVDPGLQEVAAYGEQLTLADYLDAVASRGALGERMNRFHQDFDLLVTPTLPIPAFAAGLEKPEWMAADRWADWTPFTYPFNLTGQPACSIPCGFTGDGLPAGMQIVGPRYADAMVLRAARAFESVRPFIMPAVPRVPAVA
jgi:aspartyl-tRNA(Asn)/glutamyl-tRNA(Gln) amidotransferase subunit A